MIFSKLYSLTASFFCIFLYIQNAFSQVYPHKQDSQYVISGVLLDKNTLKPVKYASIYNQTDFTISNSDGKFELSTTESQFIISCVGYEKYVNEIVVDIAKDTFLLIPDTIKLLEITITKNNSSILKEAQRNVILNSKKHFLSHHFFLRTVVRKNGKIVTIQDISGKISRENLFSLENTKKTKNYMAKNLIYKHLKLEIDNMRYISLEEDYYIYKAYKTFKKLYYSLHIGYDFAISFPEKSFTKNISDLGSLYWKIIYKRKKKVDTYYGTKEPLRTYSYEINKKENTISRIIEEYYPDMNTFREPPKLVPKKWLRILTPISKKTEVLFKYDSLLNSAIAHSILIFIGSEETEEDKESIKDIYNFTFEYISTKNFLEEKIKPNYSINKPLKMIDTPYKKIFWENQNHLLLNKEQREFIERCKKIEQNEDSKFKVYGNIPLEDL